ncbi:PilW family protein [Hydrogenophilus islandicus]
MKRHVHPIPRGLTLVELMVALTLGLIVTLVAVNVFLSNREVYRVNEQLARLQENARYALEVLARDLREAGGIPCGGVSQVANVLNNRLSNDPRDWWAQWGSGIRGYEANDNTFPRSIGTSAGNRAANTDAVIIYRATSGSVTITDHNPASAQFKVNTTQHGLNDGDIVMACDGKHAALFQITNANSSNVTIVHNTGGSVSPGNCTKGLGLPVQCTANGTSYSFQGGGSISKLTAHAWYIGCNGRADCATPAGRSLYWLTNQDPPEELVEGVRDLQLEYLRRDSSGNYVVTADQITDWSQVVAVRVELTFATTERVGTNQQEIARPWYSVIALRNRLP